MALQHWKLKQWRNAFKILEENNFHPKTVSHAKKSMEGKGKNKEIFRYPSIQNTYFPCTPIHKKALQNMFHQHNGANQERWWSEGANRSPNREQHEEAKDKKRESQSVNDPQATSGRSGRLTGKLLQEGGTDDSLSALSVLLKRRLQQLVQVWSWINISTIIDRMFVSS